MIVWQNIDRLDILVQRILKYIPKHEFKMRSQIDNASDSVGANFVEGYYSGSLAEISDSCTTAKGRWENCGKGYVGSSEKVI
jgi:four helix bundle protein